MSTFYAMCMAAVLAAGSSVATPATGVEPVAPAAAAASSGVVDQSPELAVTVANPIAAARPRETVVVSAAQVAKAAPGFDLKKAQVFDGQGREVLSQLVDENGDDDVDALIFQVDLAGKESKRLKIVSGQRHPAAASEFRAYGRFVRERHDDFAWENDRVAHRMYGPDLETCKKEPLVSSGVDVWVKRVPNLVINAWYMTDDYHQDRGEGADFYGVGKSRGGGGLGIWSGGKLAVSRNFTQSRVLANGPIRLIFELSYAPWDAGGKSVSETKRVILDAGSSFNQFESRFSGQFAGLAAGIGIAKHAGATLNAEVAKGVMRVWEPLDGGKSGNLGLAIVLPPGAKAHPESTELDYLMVTPIPSSGRLVYHMGTAWDRAGAVADSAAWSKEIQVLAARHANPVKVSLTLIKHR
jgi:unsaturated rhamnogalacturonyl hydrolase